jgi:transposase
MTTRIELSDEAWGTIKPHVPKPRKRRGRPWRDHKQVVEAILWVMATGSTWRQIPEDYGPWQTIYDRWSRWRKDGTLDKILDTYNNQLQMCSFPSRDWCVCEGEPKSRCADDGAEYQRAA